jgi:hypothetical protein
MSGKRSATSSPVSLTSRSSSAIDSRSSSSNSACTGPGHSANYGRIFNEGYLSPTSDYYKGVLRTDFLWSVVFHSRAEKSKKK